MASNTNYRYIVKVEWFSKIDSLGYQISTWCKKTSESEVFCLVCDQKIFCGKKGFEAVKQHAICAKHSNNARLKLPSSQLRLGLVVPTSTYCAETSACSSGTKIQCTKSSVSTMQLYNVAETGVRAEIIWALKNIQSCMSARSCDDLKEIFSAMFPGSVPDNFSLGRTKIGYLTTEALGPYLKKKLVQDAQQSYYSVLYDETTNNENFKELQVSLRYWSPSVNEICTRHLQTIFMGHATANDLVEKICLALADANLSTRKLLMLGCDGPNVNKAVMRIMNNIVVADRKIGLVNIGTCNIHIVHNAFLKGLGELGECASDLIIDIYNFFEDFPSRWEDYENIQEDVNIPKHRFIKHVSSRWLTIDGAAKRLLEQWPAIIKYFFTFIPNKKSDLIKTAKYTRIVQQLKKKSLMKAELLFVLNSSQLFTNFTGLFQRQEPLIHLLYDELKKVILTLVGRVCKPETLVKEELKAETLFKKENLPISKVEVCEFTSNCLKQLTELERMAFLTGAQKHYISSAKHLMNKTSIQNGCLIKHFRCLQPSQRQKERSISNISKICSLLPIDVLSTSVKDEWRLMSIQKMNSPDTSQRIDHYWREILSQRSASGDLKYPHLQKVVQASLALSHGNADLERSFSKSKRILTEDKVQMSERTLNARMIVIDALKLYNNKVTLVPITKELISMAYQAHSSYIEYLEKEKKKKQEEEKLAAESLKCLQLQKQQLKDYKIAKNKIENIEEIAKEARKEKEMKQKSSDDLFKEANERLKEAINKNDPTALRVAQGLLEGVSALRSQERLKDREVSKLEIVLNKRKSSLISDFMVKKGKQD